MGFTILVWKCFRTPSALTKQDFDQPKTQPLRGGWTRRQSAKWCHTTGGRPPTPHLSLTHSLISPFSPRWRPRQVWRHLPSDLVPLSYHSLAFLFSLSSVSCSSAFPTSVHWGVIQPEVVPWEVVLYCYYCYSVWGGAARDLLSSYSALNCSFSLTLSITALHEKPPTSPPSGGHKDNQTSTHS